MCGLYGWNVTRTLPALSVANAVLAQAMASRGTDSWGIMLDGKVKRGLESITYAPEAVRLASHHNVAVHTRYATTGKVSPKNAHPFKVGSVIGMHNGIVYNHHELNQLYDRKMTVDSQHIFAHIDENKPLSEIESYGAIVYTYADEPETIYLGRFNGGELSVARISDKQGVVGIMWASTRSALKGACKLAGLKATYYDITEGSLFRITDGRIVDTKLRLGFVRYVKPATRYGTWSTNGTSWKQTPLDSSYDKLYDESDRFYSDKCATCDGIPGEDCICEDCVCPTCQSFWYHDWTRNYPDADDDDAPQRCEPADIRALSTT